MLLVTLIAVAELETQSGLELLLLHESVGADGVAVGLFRECVFESLLDAVGLGLTDPDTLNVSVADTVLLLNEVEGK
jgi:hypothetical protein